jgi:aryl-alcohol dehydrogenase-like predicted oxidoreductase
VTTGGEPREGSPAEPEGTRRDVAIGNGALTERGLQVAELVKEVAAQLGTTRSRVALAWTLLNPAVTAPIIGVRTLVRLEDNLGALELALPEQQRARLDRASAVELGFPYDFAARAMTQNVLRGGVKIAPQA